jgi:hypothetical protein
MDTGGICGNGGFMDSINIITPKSPEGDLKKCFKTNRNRTITRHKFSPEDINPTPLHKSPLQGI